MAAAKLKSTFRVENRIAAFYTGGNVQLSADGQHLFCTHGASVNVVETSSGKVVHSIKEENCDDVTSFAVTPDDEFLVVAHRNLLLKQWDWKGEKCVRTWRAIHIGPVVSMTFDPTSTLLATGSSDSTIKLWDIVQQYCTHNLKGSQGVVSVVKFHPDSEKLLIFSAADDCKIRVWDLRTSRCKAVLESHYSAVTSFAFAEDGQTMYSSGRDNIVTVWDLDNYQVKKTIPVYEPLESVIVPPSDVDCSNIGIKSKKDFIITAGSQGQLKVWDVSSAQCVFTQRQPLAQPTQQREGQNQVTTHINQALLSAALGVIAVVTYDHNILLFKLDDLELNKQFVGYNEEILDVCFMGENDTYIAVASNSEQIRVFELSSLSCQILTGHSDIVLALNIFKNGLMMISSSKDNSVRLWSMESTSGSVHCVAVGKGHTHSVGALATARLSSKFFVSGSEDCTIKVWSIPANLSTEKSDKPVPLHVKFTERAHEKDINSIDVSPNDKLLATGSQDRTARLWHLEKETSLGSFRGHRRGIWCVQFSPTDQALATSSADGTIRIWALSDFSCVKVFEGHDASVLKVTFLSRGMQLASCGSDGLLKLWTIKTNECIKTFDEHTQKVWALAVSRDQEFIVSGGGDSNILIWKDVTEIEQEEEIQKEEDQILKEQELSNLLHEKKYLKAIGLAITLNQPYRVLTIIKNILDEPSGKENLDKTMRKMRPDQIEAVLGFCKHWNTNSKHCHTAQTVITIILRLVTPDDLMTYTTMQQTLEGLIPYTERHFERMNRLLQQAMFVDYTWQRMRRATLPVSASGSTDRTSTAAESSTSFIIDTTPAMLSPSVVDLGQWSPSSNNSIDAPDMTPNHREIQTAEDSAKENMSDGHVEKTDASPNTKKRKAKETTKSLKISKRSSVEANEANLTEDIDTIDSYTIDVLEDANSSSKKRKNKTGQVTSREVTSKLRRKQATNKRPSDYIGSDGTTDEGPSDPEDISVRTRSKDAKTSVAKTPKSIKKELQRLSLCSSLSN